MIPASQTNPSRLIKINFKTDEPEDLPVTREINLKVEPVVFEQIEEIQKVLTIWNEIALEKLHMSKTNFEINQFDNAADISENIANALEEIFYFHIRIQKQIENNSDPIIIEKLKHDLTALDRSDERFKIFACTNMNLSKHLIDQFYTGFMVLHNQKNLDRLELCYLVTNPINIRSPLNSAVLNKVQGSGTILLNKSIEIAKKLKKTNIHICPLEASIPFYLKCGFTIVQSSKEPDLQEMIYKIQSTADNVLTAASST